jgi:hypothetical protein
MMRGFVRATYDDTTARMLNVVLRAQGSLGKAIGRRSGQALLGRLASVDC